MEWIQILEMMGCYLIVALLGYYYGFHSLYITYRDKLFHHFSDKPFGWPYSGRRSKTLCNFLSCLLIISFALVFVFTKTLWEIYNLKTATTILTFLMFILIHCFVLAYSMIIGETFCTKKVKKLCKDYDIKFPNLGEK